MFPASFSFFQLLSASFSFFQLPSASFSFLQLPQRWNKNETTFSSEKNSVANSAAADISSDWVWFHWISSSWRIIWSLRIDFVGVKLTFQMEKRRKSPLHFPRKKTNLWNLFHFSNSLKKEGGKKKQKKKKKKKKKRKKKVVRFFSYFLPLLHGGSFIFNRSASISAVEFPHFHISTFPRFHVSTFPHFRVSTFLFSHHSFGPITASAVVIRSRR